MDRPNLTPAKVETGYLAMDVAGLMGHLAAAEHDTTGLQLKWAAGKCAAIRARLDAVESEIAEPVVRAEFKLSLVER